MEKLIEGRDGCCRAAQVKLANGNRIQRPLQLLFPLEVQDTESDHKESKSEDINMTSDSQLKKKERLLLMQDKNFTCGPSDSFDLNQLLNI